MLRALPAGPAPWLLLGLILLLPLPLPAQEKTAEPSPAQAKALVQAATGYARENSLKDLIRAINDPAGPFSLGPLRVFVLDLEEGVLLADPLRPGLVGRRVREMIDSKGRAYYRAMEEIAAGTGSGWTDHFIVPPGLEYADIEAVYVARVPSLKVLVGCGIFDLDAPTAEAQSR